VTHRFEVRVYYEDTDAGGVVYHAGYLRFAERARTELLRAGGLDHRTLLERAGGQLVVRRLEADFLAPARLDELLSVETRPLAATGARVLFEQAIRSGETLLVRLAVEIAFVGRDGRPRRLPEALRRALAPAAPARPARVRP
jgi:acyl-CoA thioester hydrolase